jgi:hypothetical protein
MKEGVIYLVNLGALSLIKIRIKEIIGDETVVEYLNTTPVRTETFNTDTLKKLITGL